MTHANFFIARLPAALLVLLTCLLSSGCGLKGNLYLPEKNSAPVIITPASSSSSSSSDGAQ